MNKIYFLILCFFLFVTNSFAQITEEELEALNKPDVKRETYFSDDHPWGNYQFVKVEFFKDDNKLKSVKFLDKELLTITDASNAEEAHQKFLTQINALINFDINNYELKKSDYGNGTLFSYVRKFGNYKLKNDEKNGISIIVKELNKISSFGSSISEINQTNLIQKIDSTQAEKIAQNKIFGEGVFDGSPGNRSRIAAEVPEVWVYNGHAQLVWIAIITERSNGKINVYEVLVDAENGEVVRIREKV